MSKSQYQCSECNKVLVKGDRAYVLDMEPAKDDFHPEDQQIPVAEASYYFICCVDCFNGGTAG